VLFKFKFKEAEAEASRFSETIMVPFRFPFSLVLDGVEIPRQNSLD